MKRGLKCFVTSSCVFCISVSSLNVVHASNSNDGLYNNLSIDLSTDFSDDEKISIMREYGFSEEDIVYFMDRERTPEMQNYLSRSFPSNPYIGQWHIEDYTFTKAALGFVNVVIGSLSMAEVAKAIASRTNIPVASCIGLAAVILNWHLNNNGYNGYIVTINYLYTYNNDGLLGWNTGLMDVTPYI